MQVRSYAAFEKGGEMKEHTYDQPPLPEDYVDVRVTHCGICFTDIAMVSGEFGFEHFPLVPGHEVSGVVHAIGKAVTNVKVGDRVGCHNIRSCCNGCGNCTRGYTEMCTRHDWLVAGKGGFGEFVRMQAPFLYVLPEALSNENAASLMCAGSTIWASLREPGIRAGDRVAILGIGGLGHLGLKFARAFGCEVAAISTSRSKEADAKKLGAHHFIVSSDEADVKKYTDFFDLIIVTATAPIDFKPLLMMMRDKGTIAIPGAVGEELKLPTMLTMMKGLRIMGICGCGRKEQSEMIEFCAKNKIFPEVEPLAFSKINEGFERVKKGTPRYRVVLHADWK